MNIISTQYQVVRVLLYYHRNLCHGDGPIFPQVIRVSAIGQYGYGGLIKEILNGPNKGLSPQSHQMSTLNKGFCFCNHIKPGSQGRILRFKIFRHTPSRASAEVL